MIQIAIQIECLQGTKFNNQDCDLDSDNFVLCNQGTFIIVALKDFKVHMHIFMYLNLLLASFNSYPDMSK